MESEFDHTSGYLRLEPGDGIHIQFLGEPGTADDGFAYGRKIMISSLDRLEEGWFSRDKVALLPPSFSQDTSVGVLLDSPERITMERGALSNIFIGLVKTKGEEGVGYLGMVPGDMVIVLFIGADDSENAGYCYCKTLHHAHGWIRSSAILSWLPGR